MDKVVYFDGVCNLCSGAIQFILKRNSKENLKFASLQSVYGQTVVKELGLNQLDFETIIYQEGNQFYQKSDAILKIAKELDGAWKLVSVLKVFPKFIRDGVYGFIGRNRYNFFGKKDQCWLPTPALKARFLN
jgi:predicted DCC family thiol-disulfide oxidoreductase YuxK